MAAGYAVLMAGGTLAIPLFPIWSKDLGFGPLTTTVVFAAYAVGVALSLLVLAPLSDRVGRRAVLLAVTAVSVVSTVAFLLVDGLAVLLAARVLSGVAAGALAATATAALAELARPDRGRWASLVATAANLGGLGGGVLACGLLVQFVSEPHPPGVLGLPGPAGHDRRRTAHHPRDRH